jgi:hypothetical protein
METRIQRKREKEKEVNRLEERKRKKEVERKMGKRKKGMMKKHPPGS